MALRNIRTDNDPILRKISKEVGEVSPRMVTLVEDMFETMYHAQGVGLAAPQIGILRRLIVLDDYEGNKYSMFNPEIISGEGCQTGPEGCLSVPGRQGTVERKNSIRVKYMDINGNSCELEAEGFLARIIQHEIDHLNGILYTDIATELFTLEELEEMENKKERQKEVVS
ncbi:MAG: peptide deformylase [Tissierellia bacterium]|nr:peptide deformylase [Tissierellia bacterium]